MTKLERVARELLQLLDRVGWPVVMNGTVKRLREALDELPPATRPPAPADSAPRCRVKPHPAQLELELGDRELAQQQHADDLRAHFARQGLQIYRARGQWWFGWVLGRRALPHPLAPTFELSAGAPQ